jgi:hypothetical protein
MGESSPQATGGTVPVGETDWRSLEIADLHAANLAACKDVRDGAMTRNFADWST